MQARNKQALQVDHANDDILQAIAKMGGIDTEAGAVGMVARSVGNSRPLQRRGCRVICAGKVRLRVVASRLIP